MTVKCVLCFMHDTIRFSFVIYDLEPYAYALRTSRSELSVWRCVVLCSVVCDTHGFMIHAVGMLPVGMFEW